jgi:hypothetical protein
METAKEKSEREKASWQYRAIEVTRGPGTKTGAILLAVLGKQRATVPQFRGSARITSDGYMLCNFMSRSGQIHMSAFVGSVEEVVANFRRLADHLKLTDAERTEMFTKLREWVGTDYRSNKTWQ